MNTDQNKTSSIDPFFDENFLSAKQFLSKVINEAPIIIFVIDITGKFILSEGKGLKRLGLNAGQVVGEYVHDVYKDVPEIIEQSKKAIRGKDVRTIVKLGDIYFETLYQPVFDDNNEVKYVIGIAFDVSEQKKAEKERDIFFNYTMSMICTANMEGFFTQLNPAWEKILGYTNEELMSKSFLEFVHPDDIESTITEIESLSTGKNTLNFTNRYLCKNGDYKWLNWISVPLGDKIYASAIDISELKNNENAQKVLLKELERSNNDLEQFAYAASHDLQEPLRKIKNYSDLLSHKYSNTIDDEANKYFDIITRASARMQALIDDLLTFSRITSRGKEMKNISINDILDFVMDNLEFSIVKNKAQIITPEFSPVIYCDFSQICQVFQNLISNSLKYKSEKNPIIKIDVREQNDTWLFKIEDNGIGIDMQYADKIFVIFQRLHSQNQFDGTGIGLALCKKIIERHGGNIWVESKPNEGAVFNFTILKNTMH